MLLLYKKPSSERFCASFSELFLSERNRRTGMRLQSYIFCCVSSSYASTLASHMLLLVLLLAYEDDMKI